MVKNLASTDTIGVDTEHNPTLHLWLLSLFIMLASVTSLFVVGALFALNFVAVIGFLLATGLSLWAIKAVIDRMKWH
jgi:hypothetical protein